MPDNVAFPAGAASGKAASREVSYSGETAQLQAVTLALVTGADDAKVATDVSTGNPVPVSIAGTVATSVTANGVVSTANSSVATLGIGAVFTGASEDVTEHADLRVNVFSDQVSATDGLQIQQSSNGTNWDIADSYTIPAGSGKTFSVGVSARFARVVYTNGGVAQTAFRLQTKFHKTYSKGSSVRPQDGRTNDNDYEEMLTHLMGFNGASWDRLRSTIANGLAVDVTRLSALVAGSAVVGKVGIDQTTPGTTNAVSVPDLSTSGSLASLNATLALAVTNCGSAAIEISGTWVGTITFEASLGGTVWTGINATAASTSTPAVTTTVNGLYRLSPAGVAQIRANMSAFTSGSATIAIRSSVGSAAIFANQILPTRVTDGTNTATVKAASTASAASDPAVVVGLSPNSPVPLPTLTKGTQGATGVATQDLKDAGRVNWSAAAAIAGVTAVATEALVTMIVQRDGTAIASATSHTVTAAKRLRITGMTVGLISTGASVLSGRISLRIGAAGAATATSPIVVTLAIPSGAALAQAGGSMVYEFPDGFEISGSQQVGCSQVCSAATGTIWVNLIGYEY